MPTIPQADLEQYGEVIDRLVTTPVGKSRGNMFQPMKAVDMYDAARARFGRPLCLLAAEMISERVKRDDNVLILTGSYHPLHFPVGEMDGPPGGATLALSLDLGLGAKPFFANEPPLVGPDGGGLPRRRAAAHALRAGHRARPHRRRGGVSHHRPRGEPPRRRGADGQRTTSRSW